MKLYYPKYKPGDLVFFKSGNEVIYAAVEYAKFNQDDGWKYHLTGWMSLFEEDWLIGAGIHTPLMQFEIDKW